MKKERQLKGQSLVETLVAMTIAMILLTVATGSIITALNSTQSSNSRNMAGKYAQQGMEIIRQMRDSNWTTFSALSGSYCMAQNCTSLGSGSCGSGSSCGTNITGGFSRQVQVAQDSSACPVQGSSSTTNGTKVIITVSWTDSKCRSNNCEKIKLESCFANLFGNPNL
jgi:Tfp pilus assembly protein PilV